MRMGERSLCVCVAGGTGRDEGWDGMGEVRLTEAGNGVTRGKYQRFQTASPGLGLGLGSGSERVAQRPMPHTQQTCLQIVPTAAATPGAGHSTTVSHVTRKSYYVNVVRVSRVLYPSESPVSDPAPLVVLGHLAHAGQ